MFDSKPIKYAVLSLSGGMDSSTLLLHLLDKGYFVETLSFDYGQKHKIELQKAEELIVYLLSKKFRVRKTVIKLEGIQRLLNSTLVEGGGEVPEGHYQQENMKLTVVPNRNKIFSSISQAVALSIAIKYDTECLIALGIHGGDHCFSKNMKILTPTGLKSVEELEVGESIYSFDIASNTWQIDVLKNKIQKNKVNKINLIKTTAGELELTDEHEVFILKVANFHNIHGYEKSIVKVKVKDLEEEDYLIQPTSLEGPQENLDRIDLLPIAKKLVKKYEKGITLKEEEGYIWLGGDSEKYKLNKIPRLIKAEPFVNLLAWYIAEGCSQKDAYVVKGSMSRYSATFYQSLKANLDKVELIIKDFKEAEAKCKYEFSKIFHNKIPKEVTFYISNILSIFMKECGAYSAIKEIPEWLMSILVKNNYLRESFLYTLGIADGFNTETDYKGFCSTSNKLIEQVITLFQLSGYHFSISEKNKNITYVSFSRKGKKEASISLGEAKFAKIKSVSIIDYDDYVYDLSIEKNHNFLAGQFGSLLISNSIYPDCRQEFRDLDFEVFKIGNWESERVKVYTPYLNMTKFDILKEGEEICNRLGISFDEVYSKTNTSYKPIFVSNYVLPDITDLGGTWYSDYKSAASVERVEAFIKLGKVDPIQYADETGVVSWDVVKRHVEKVLKLM